MMLLTAGPMKTRHKPALLWTNDRGECHQFTFGEMKKYSDQTASFFQSAGIGRGDMVMLILKRHYQFWFSILALHKLGATAIPASHLLTEKDIVYRCNMAGIKAIVSTGDKIIVDHVEKALPKCPTLNVLVSTGPIVPDGWFDFNKSIAAAKPFERPQLANTNSDVSLLYFTSGTTGEPKMVAHDFTYPLGHIVTGYIWHNLRPDSLHLTLADTGWGKGRLGKALRTMDCRSQRICIRLREICAGRCPAHDSKIRHNFVLRPTNRVPVPYQGRHKQIRPVIA